MRLLVVSHTPHYLSQGQLVGWSATVREIDRLAEIFDETVHIAPLHSGPAENAAAYCSPKVHVRTVTPAGGARVLDKIGILARVPTYVRVIVRELRSADVVHVRCPANISLIAIVLLTLMRKPRLRWVKYAGSWAPSGSEAQSYKFQRWWLNRNLHRGVVTVNGDWPDQPVHVHSFPNPCLTDEEFDEVKAAAFSKELSSPIKLIYVGRLESAKGVDKILRIVAALRQRNLSVCLELVGDGPERGDFETQALELDIQSITTFRGWLSRSDLTSCYRNAHILLLPSESEGWPKVVSEAMAYGVVPVASAVGSIPQYLESFGTGKALSPDHLDEYVSAISDYAANYDSWKRESLRAVETAQLFTYSNYVRLVRGILGMESADKQRADIETNIADLRNSPMLEASVPANDPERRIARTGGALF